MKNKMLKVWFFERNGEEVLDNLFQTEKEWKQFSAANELEEFKSEWVYV